MKIEVCFSTPKRWNPISWLIRRFEGTLYSHAFIKFETIAGTKIFESAFDGIGFKPYNKKVKSHRIVKSYSINTSKQQLTRVKDLMICLEDRDYGYTTILGNMINRLFPRIKKDIFTDGNKTLKCAEALVFVLRRGGLSKVDYKETDGPAQLDKQLSLLGYDE